MSTEPSFRTSSHNSSTISHKPFILSNFESGCNSALSQIRSSTQASITRFLITNGVDAELILQAVDEFAPRRTEESIESECRRDLDAQLYSRVRKLENTPVAELDGVDLEFMILYLYYEGVGIKTKALVDRELQLAAEKNVRKSTTVKAASRLEARSFSEYQDAAVAPGLPSASLTTSTPQAYISLEGMRSLHTIGDNVTPRGSSAMEAILFGLVMLLVVLTLVGFSKFIGRVWKSMRQWTFRAGNTGTFDGLGYGTLRPCFESKSTYCDDLEEAGEVGQYFDTSDEV